MTTAADIEPKTQATSAPKPKPKPKPKSKAKSKYLTIRFWAFQIHLWIGLTIGMTFTMVGFSGSMLILSDYIDKWSQPELRTVTPPTPNAEPKPFSAILAAFREKYPRAQVSFVLAPKAADETWNFTMRGADADTATAGSATPAKAPAATPAREQEILKAMRERRAKEEAGIPVAPPTPVATPAAKAAAPATQPAGQNAQRRRTPSKHVFVDPYRATVLGEYQAAPGMTFNQFFSDMHYYLLLPREPGYKVNGIHALVIGVVLLAGLVLSWPSTVKLLLTRLWVKWKAPFARVNWDIHNALGAWTLPVMLVLMITGFYFPWALELKPKIEKAFGPVSPPQKFEINADPDAPPATLDDALATIARTMPDAQVLLISGLDRGRDIRVMLNQPRFGMTFRNNVTIDRRSGQIASIESPSNFTDYFIKSILPLHTGQFFGGWMRWVYFAIGFVPLILFVSGTWIWGSRQIKKFKAYRAHKVKAKEQSENN